MSLREKKTSGRQWSPDFCCKTPPIWVSEASVAKESSVFGAGCWRGTAAAMRRFAFWNASCAETVHSNVLAPPFRRSVTVPTKSLGQSHTNSMKRAINSVKSVYCWLICVEVIDSAGIWSFPPLNNDFLNPGGHADFPQPP